jgi:hypothetical protein
MELLNYLLKVSACTAIFFAFYLLILRRLTFFKINRFYLLVTLLISFVIPSLHFTVENEVPLVAEKAVVTATPMEMPLPQISDLPSKQMDVAPVAFDWTQLIMPFYTLTVGVLLMIAICRLVQLLRHTVKDPIKINNLKLVAKTTGFTNCSFFNYVFIDKDRLSENELEILLAHESVHARQYHSIDKLVMLLAKAFLWFNPIVYLYDKVLEEAHEFEADEATSQSFGSENYANLLLRLAVVKTDIPLVHNFVKSPIKERIKMLFNQKSKNMKKLVYVLALPIVLGLVWLFAVQNVYAQRKTATNQKSRESTVIQKDTTKKKSKVEKLTLLHDNNLKLDTGDKSLQLSTTGVEPVGVHATEIVVNADKSLYHLYEGKMKIGNNTVEGNEIIWDKKAKIIYIKNGKVTSDAGVVSGKLINYNLKNANYNVMEPSSDVKVIDNSGCKITKVENDDEYTVISFEYVASKDTDWALLNKEIYIQANNDMKHFGYVKSEGIPLAPKRHDFTKAGEKLAFKVYFEKVPNTAKSFDVIERAGRSDFFNFYDVKIPSSAIAN